MLADAASQLVVESYEQMLKDYSPDLAHTERRNRLELDLSGTEGVDLRYLWPLPLEALNVAGCGLDDSCGLAALRKVGLKKLNLMSNALQAVPMECFDEGSVLAARLELLGLKGNRLARLPPSIGALRRLTALFLTDNRLEVLPPEIGQLTELRKLQAASNRLRGLPEQMCAMARLELLRVPVNAISDVKAVAAALSAPRLRWLSLASNAAFDTPQAAKDALAALPVVDFAELRSMGALSDEEFGGASGGEVTRVFSPKHGEVALKLFAAASSGVVSPDGAAEDERALVAHLGDECEHVPVALARLEGERKGLLLRLVEGRPLAMKPRDSVRMLRCRYAADALFDARWALSVARGVAAGACHMRERGVCHGDIYAHNVLVDDAGKATLIDLGASFAYARQGSDSAASRVIEAAESRALGTLISELAERVPEVSRQSSAHAAMVAAAAVGEQGAPVSEVMEALLVA